MVGGRCFEHAAERHVRREDVVCDPDEEGVRVREHVPEVGLEEVAAEEGVFEVAGEAFDEELGVGGCEEGLPFISLLFIPI